MGRSFMKSSISTYQDANQSIQERVEDLLSRMTLEQKVAQLQCIMLAGQGEGFIENILEKFPDGLGNATSFNGQGTVEGNVELAKKTQDTVIARNKLGIPVLLHCESLTGACVTGATIFPSAIGLGATWNPETVEKMADLTRKQMLAVGIRQALSPVMDVARDPRWGRVGETYGEDPTLCASMSVAFTKGLQTDDLKNGAVATAKHFLGYSFGEGGLNMAPNPIPQRELREVYAKPFQAAISEAGLASVMNSYGTLDGEMIITSKHILDDLLRDEMGFNGILVTDYMSINRAVDYHTQESALSAGIATLKAGMDVELPTPYGYTQELVDAVRNGELDVAFVDRAVFRVLETKFKLGLFENPYPMVNMAAEAYDRKISAPLSLKAAQESIVLLKNDRILPLSKDLKKIAVIGPHADSLRLLFGCYTYPAMLDMMISGSMTEMAGVGAEQKNSLPKQPYYEGSTVRQDTPFVLEIIKQLYGDKTPTILASIQAKCPNAQIVYEKGCDIAGTDRTGFAAAITAAQDAEVVILTLGGKYGWGTNCTTGEGVDADNIGLTGVQEELAKAIFETGTPAVMVHMDSKPLSSGFISENYPVIVENWFPGETGGQALADVLFGDYNPAGRLPMTAARNAGQIPIYASHKRGSGYTKSIGMNLSKYAEGEKTPLHYLGEGMSYTSFAYSNLKLDKTVKADGILRLSCEVTNTGDRDGEEVVQVYVSDDLASMLRPVKELAGFKRVAIKAGKTKPVHFEMKADQFAFLDVDMKWIVEAGQMTIEVGASSEDIRLSDTFEIVNTLNIDGKNRGFYAKAWVK
jgi:beta-glucosidase